MNPTRRRLLRLAPLSAFAIAGSAGYVLVEGRLAVPEGPITLGLTQTLPRFTLPGLNGDGFSAGDLEAFGKPVLLNIFASWCAPCVREAASLMKLRDGGLTIWGIAYKDKPDATRTFLREHGDPYARIARDDSGAVSAGFGLTGVPETFLLDRGGAISWRWAGELTEDVVSRYLQPILRSMG